MTFSLESVIQAVKHALYAWVEVEKLGIIGKGADHSKVRQPILSEIVNNTLKI
jgi:hypothetical protein